MSFGGDEGSEVGFTTARGRDWPSVRQFNVFVENRLGNLLNVIRALRDERQPHRLADDRRLGGLRYYPHRPERSGAGALEVFQQAGLQFTESDLLVVQLPESNQPLLAICKALLTAEINIDYAYPLLIGPHGRAALALHVEDHDTAAQTLDRSGFVLFTENDLNE